MANELQLEERKLTTNAYKKQLRQAGKIPAIVYGESIENTTVSVDQKQIVGILKTNPNAVLQVDIPGQGKHPIMIGEIQRHPISRDIVHIDLQQIDIKNPIRVMVRLETVGEAVGAREGGVLQMPLTEIEIECLPHLIPSSIQVDVSELSIGDSVLISDLQVPEGITVLTPAEDVVASVLAPTREEVADEAADGEEAEATAEEAAPEEEQTESE